MTNFSFDELAAQVSKKNGAKLILTTDNGKRWKQWSGGAWSVVTEDEIEQQCLELGIDYGWLRSPVVEEGPVGIPKWHLLSKSGRREIGSIVLDGMGGFSNISTGQGCRGMTTCSELLKNANRGLQRMIRLPAIEDHRKFKGRWEQ